MADPLDAAGPEPEAVRAAVDAILSGPEYQPPGDPLLTRILDAILGFLDGLTEGVGGSGPASTIAVLVALALAAFALVLLFRALRTPSPRRRRRSDGLGATAHERRWTAAQWAAEAAACSHRGEHLLAMRAHFHRLVAALDEADVLDEGRNLTPHEVAGAVAALHTSLTASVEEAVSSFEGAWYGSETATAARCESMAAAIDSVLAVATGVRT